MQLTQVQVEKYYYSDNYNIEILYIYTKKKKNCIKIHFEGQTTFKKTNTLFITKKKNHHKMIVFRALMN